MLRAVSLLLAASAALVSLLLAAPETSFRFVLLGDHTGEAQPGVYERVWQQAAAEAPAFVLSVGDTIEGLNDATAAGEWREALAIFNRYSRIPLYLTPGNHDVWSPLSEKLFRQYAGHPLHYSFDYGQAHFTILDNSRSDELPAAEIQFLQSDLEAHRGQPLKFVISHRPSWLLDAGLQNPDFPLQRIAKEYGVRYIIAGHIHQMLHMELEGITYVSLPSAGGHLRLSGRYEDGWFFGHTLVEVRGREVRFHIEEVGGRKTELSDWGMLGLKARVAVIGPNLAG